MADSTPAKARKRRHSEVEADEDSWSKITNLLVEKEEKRFDITH
jgi:hypothetical protein